MKKSNFVLGALALIMASALVFTGCNPQPEPEPEVLTHTVTFDADGGTGIEAVTVNDGETVAKPENPTKEGYSFGTWMNGEVEYDFDEPVTTDLTLKATWTEITCKVTFNTDGGSEVEAITVKYGEKVTLPETDPTKDGVNFAGWYTDAEFTTPYTDAAIKADTVLYAKWSTDPVYTITLNYNYEGSKDASVKAVKESEYKVTAPTGEREDYKLAGWYTDKECTTAVDFTAAFSADTTIYAKWTRVYSLKDETADLYKVYLAAEGSTATVKKFTNGAVAAFLETTNNGTEVVLNVKEDGSAASSATYDKVTVKFDYEVCEWSDETVTPKFRIGSDAFATTTYLAGKVAGGTIEQNCVLASDITSIKIGFNAYEWTGAATDRIKIIVRSVTLNEKKAFELGDETEGSYTLNLASATATQKKTYTNGAVAALLETNNNGSDLTFNVKANGSSVSSNDYTSLKITFDYEKINWAAADSEVSAKFRVSCDGVAGYNNSHTEYFESSATSGTLVKTFPMISDANFSTVKIGFNAYGWTGSANDSIKIVVRKVELTEKVVIAPGTRVYESDISGSANGVKGESNADGSLTATITGRYGGQWVTVYINEDKSAVEAGKKVKLVFDYEFSSTCEKNKFALNIGTQDRSWEKNYYTSATVYAECAAEPNPGTVEYTFEVSADSKVVSIQLSGEAGETQYAAVTVKEISIVE